jgi:hypothetical protein
MCCTTLIAQETTMSTTQLMRVAHYEVCWPTREEQGRQYQPLRMNWVVVTDANGNRRLQMGWRADRDD